MSGRTLRCGCLTRPHRHGCRRRYATGCRCSVCRAGNAAYTRLQWRRSGYRQWTGDTVWTDPTGTQRRLQALAALGWTLDQIGAHVGCTGSAIGLLRVTTQTRILRTTAQRVTDAYKQLGAAPPPPSKCATYTRQPHGVTLMIHKPAHSLRGMLTGLWSHASAPANPATRPPPKSRPLSLSSAPAIYCPRNRSRPGSRHRSPSAAAPAHECRRPDDHRIPHVPVKGLAS
jgi:hypothetical protein